MSAPCAYVGPIQLTLHNLVICLSHLALASSLPHSPPPHFEKSPSPGGTLLKCKPTNPESTLSTLSLLGSRIRVLYTYPNHPRAKYQIIRDSPYAPELTELIPTNQSQACLPRFTHSFPRKSQSRLLPSSSFSLCLLTAPSASPCSHHCTACPLFLGTVINKLSFQWQPSPDLFAFLYMTSSINTLYF